MDIQKEREAFEKSYAEMLIGGELKGLESVIFAKYLESGEYAQDKVDTAWCMWQAAKAQAVPEGLRKSQGKVKVYELHVKTLKQIHENEFNEKSESSYILGNLDGFFECLESDLGEIK